MKSDLVIYDGSNFYHGAKRAFPNIHLTNFNYRRLAKLITNTKTPNVEYCVGEIKKRNSDSRSRRLYSNQQKLFFHLHEQKIEMKLGYMLKTDGIYREKGVDVRIALDILRGALKNEYRRCYLISSDTDLIPAIQDARNESKNVIYVGFKENLSFALQAVCSQTIIITRKMISG